MTNDRIGSPDDRFRKSATKLPEPIVFGNDYSKHPIPGQQGLALASAGYAEAYGTPPDEDGE